MTVATVHGIANAFLDLAFAEWDREGDRGGAVYAGVAVDLGIVESSEKGFSGTLTATTRDWSIAIGYDIYVYFSQYGNCSKWHADYELHRFDGNLDKMVRWFARVERKTQIGFPSLFDYGEDQQD